MSGAAEPDTKGGVAGRTALVTGASSGYGEAIARRLVQGGARVVAAARRLERLDALASELGDAVHPVRLDVRDPGAVDEVVAGLPEHIRDVDILVNNAGLALGLGSAQEADLDQWQQMIETNCLGLVACTRALLPGMVERGRGHVVNLGSIAGSYPYPGGNVYGATKAFVKQFSLNLRSDLHGTGVRVTCVEPGLSEGTEFSVVRFGGEEDQAAAVASGVDALTAGDVAEGVLWALRQPAHVNVNRVELMPVAQSPAGLRIHRGE